MNSDREIEDRFGEIRDIAILIGVIFVAGSVFLVSTIVLVLKWWSWAL